MNRRMIGCAHVAALSLVMMMSSCGDGGSTVQATTTTVPATTEAPSTTAEVTTTESTTTTTSTTLPPTTVPPTAAPKPPGIKIRVTGPAAGSGCSSECYWISGSMNGYPAQELYVITGVTMFCSFQVKPGKSFKGCPIEVGTMAGASVHAELYNPEMHSSNTVSVPS